MSSWLLSLILAGIISIVSSLFEAHENTNTKLKYVIRVFVVAFITIYFGLQFLTQDCIPEINTGDPPF
jgi:hypothetical protein